MRRNKDPRPRMGAQSATLEEVFGGRDLTSPAMAAAIRRWIELYFEEGGFPDGNPCQRLPYVVVNKLYRAAFAEYTARWTGGGGPDGTVQAEALSALNDVARQAVQLALMGGECLLKPVLLRGRFRFLPLRRDCYQVLGRDPFGEPTAVGCGEVTLQEGKRYTLLEKRSLGEDGLLTVENRLFCSRDRLSLGREVALDTLERYAGLQDKVKLEKTCGLGLVRMRTPMENCVDGSPDGVAVYAAAEELIRAIDRNERQMDEEFENGVSRVIASADLLGERGGTPALTDRLFVGLDGSPQETGLAIFSPALRHESYLARKQEYLRNLETVIGLKRGILSQVEAAPRTATEVTSSEGDYSLTILELQRMWEESARKAMALCHRLGQLYGVLGDGDFRPEQVEITWGDQRLFS